VALEATNKIRDYNKMYYDKKHKIPTKYNKEGDFTVIRETQVKPGESKKMKPSYRDPYMIKKALITTIDTWCKTYLVSM